MRAANVTAAGASARVGWCPGALRPMDTGDGLIVRVKPRGGVLGLAAAIAVTKLALRHGNGELDLTGRANLQIRGVREDSAEPLVDGLRDLGLIDASAEAEAVRNLVGSPLAGIDQQASLDVGPLVHGLEDLLLDDRSLWRLPAKWSIVVDGGGSLNLRGITADIRFEALADGSIAVGLGEDASRAPCAPDAVPAIAAALCRQALGPEPKRMGRLLQERGAAVILAAAGLRPSSRAMPEQAPSTVVDAVGRHTFGQVDVLGIAAPFGRLAASELLRLLETVQAAGATELRLTPWRTLFVTGPARVLSPAAALRDALATSAFITDPGDPRLAVAACSGQPACRRATTPVRQHAAALAKALSSLQSGIALHISGCAKGCAHARPAPWTLVGRDGHYDLVRDGKAGDAPLARDLTFQEAANWLSRERETGPS